MMKPLQLMLIATMLTAGVSGARAGVIAEWRFDAIAGGTTLEDQVGTIDGAVTANVDVVTSGAGVSGATGFDNAYDFLGNSNSVYVNMGTTATTGAISNFGTSAFTIAGWFDADERNSAGNYRYIFSNLGTNGGFIIHLGTPGTASSRGKLLVQVGAGTGAVTVQSAGRLDLTSDSQQWHWFAATSDGATLKVFVDGTLIGSAAYNGSTTATPDAGSTSLIGRAFDGRIDQISVWNQQLGGALDGGNNLTSGELYDLWRQSIPEPASVALLSLGGLLMLRRGGSF
ncbi:MAG: LamG domain-containing protein [Phycisphaeraceae bacterium]|nr:LamG domain-containing protein [Phycisphaeraceae bacterium]